MFRCEGATWHAVAWHMSQRAIAEQWLFGDNEGAPRWVEGHAGPCAWKSAGDSKVPQGGRRFALRVIDRLYLIDMLYWRGSN